MVLLLSSYLFSGEDGIVVTVVVSFVFDVEEPSSGVSCERSYRMAKF